MPSPTKFDARQIVQRATLPMVGSVANEQLNSILSKIDPELSKLFEDRNLLMVGNGSATFNSNILSISGNLQLHVNSRVSGGSPVVIPLLTNPTTLNFSSSGMIWYVVIDRIAGTASSTLATTMPTVVAANQEVFLIAKRVDDSTDAKVRLYFRTGFVMNDGDSAKFGSGGGASTAFLDNVFNIDNASDITKKIMFDASAITTGTTRTIKMADSNIDLQSIPDEQEIFNQGTNPFVNTSNFIIAPTVTTGSPASGFFYSTIVGRESMPDLSKNLKVHMGVERIVVQSIHLSPTEQGPNGEPVYKTPNDTLNQIRFVGTWITPWNAAVYNYENSLGTQNYGTYTAGGPVNDFLEITFYGTGLNLLGLVDTGYDMRASVDGGAEGSNITPNQSNFLNHSSYSANLIYPVTKGLTQGIHTVKIRTAVTASAFIYGFEILNEVSSLVINPGIGYAAGRKNTTANQVTSSYNSSFDSGTLGTKGGRVIVYQKSDGTIGKALTPTDVTQNLFTATDHSNEEVARTYYFREFSSSRSDDINQNNAANDVVNSPVFTLDDNTTMLSIAQVSFADANQDFEGEVEGCAIEGSITFIGTGIDLFQTRPNSTTTYNVRIDGVDVLTGVSSTSLGIGGGKWWRVASGLPYGTHNLQIFVNTSVVANMQFNRFTIYQPKKPVIPAGAVPLADYNIMANFAFNTQNELISQAPGTIRKWPGREFVYQEGTGGTTNWVADEIALNKNILGVRKRTDRTGASVQTTFWGTGFDYRFATFSNGSNNVTFFLNGVQLNSTNFPGVTTNILFGTYTPSTGVLNTVGGNNDDDGLAVSGLPLGVYTLQIVNNNAGGYMSINAIDVITPIYSSKDNLPVNQQNTLNVGNCSSTDIRLFSPLAANNAVRWAQAVGLILSPTTTIATDIPVPDMFLSFKCTDKPVEVLFRGGALNALSNGGMVFSLYVDGLPSNAWARYESAGTVQGTSQLSDHQIMKLSPGYHFFQIFWRNGGGPSNTINSPGYERILTVKELSLV